MPLSRTGSNFKLNLKSSLHDFQVQLQVEVEVASEVAVTVGNVSTVSTENKGEREKGRGGEERPKIKIFHYTLVLMGTPFFGAAPPAGRLRRAESTESTERYFSASPQSTYSGLCA